MEKRKEFEGQGFLDAGGEVKRSRFDDGNSTVEADYFVEQRLVGWIIGRGGATLKEIEGSYQVKIVVDQSNKEMGYSQLRVAGPQIMVTQAADHINMSLARAVQTTEGGEPVGPFLLDSPPSAMADKMYEEMKIEQRFVGWLLGRGGAVIREIELTANCKISINQDSRATGFSRAQLHGNMDERLHAKQLIGESIAKAMESPAGNAAPRNFGGIEEDVQVEQKWIGWLVGRQGGVIKEIEQEFLVRISIDQSTKSMGFSTVKICGSDPASVALARDRIQGHVQKVGGNTPQQAMMAGDPFAGQMGVPADPFSDFMNSAAGTGGATVVDINIEQQWVGWLLGKAGTVMKEIETASGAKVVVNQDTKGMGYSVAQVSGHPSAVALAKSMIEEKLLQVNPSGNGFVSQQTQGPPAQTQGYAPLLSPQASASAYDGASAAPVEAMMPEESIDLTLEQRFVGWILGKNHATLREIEAQTGARISIDQTNKHLGHSVVKIAGGASSVIKAQQRIQASLAMAAGGQPAMLSLAPSGSSGGGAVSGMSMTGASGDFSATAAGLASTAAQVPGVAGMGASSPPMFAPTSTGELQVEQQMVGWIVGTRGAVLQEIENTSGTRISIDQSTKELGYSTARINGTAEAQAIARQMISEKISQAHPAGPPGSNPLPQMQAQTGLEQQFGGGMFASGGVSTGQFNQGLMQGFLQ